MASYSEAVPRLVHPKKAEITMKKKMLPPALKAALMQKMMASQGAGGPPPMAPPGGAPMAPPGGAPMAPPGGAPMAPPGMRRGGGVKKMADGGLSGKPINPDVSQDPSKTVGKTEGEKRLARLKAGPKKDADDDMGSDAFRRGGKVKKMASGGLTRGDGCAQSGKTKGKVV